MDGRTTASPLGPVRLRCSLRQRSTAKGLASPPKKAGLPSCHYPTRAALLNLLEGGPSTRRNHAEAVLAALAAPLAGSELALRAAARPTGRRIVLWSDFWGVALSISRTYRRCIHVL